MTLKRAFIVLIMLSSMMYVILGQDDDDQGVPIATARPTLTPMAVETLIPTATPTITMTPIQPTVAATPTLMEAAEETISPAIETDILLSVVVDSAFIRSAPSLDTKPSASAVEGDRLQAIGRNADGTWYEVARPYSTTRLGWISREVIGRPNSDIFSLPITSTVGVTGDTPVFDTGFAAFVLGESALRSEPGLQAERVGIVPNSVTIPVLARNQDGSSIQVNYNGHVGWIAAFLLRISTDPLDLPVAENIPPPIFVKVEIPYELQIAQVERLQTYAETQFSEAQGMSIYWDRVINGEVLPCDTFTPVEPYRYSERDVQELPELQRVAPRMAEAIDFLNQSRSISECGVLPLGEVSSARAAAINARFILRNSLFEIENIEEIVNTRRD